ncbi:hypothetical protein BH24ACT5_BH24ACT5_20110 [soil metagenome]
MKRREHAVGPGALPPRIAAGPTAWPSLAEWMTAGRQWSRDRGPEAHGWHNTRAWLDLLEPDVAYWASALGRMHYRSIAERHASRNYDPSPATMPDQPERETPK